MKKSVIFLINGLGIEKPGSYSIAIDQCMPRLSRTKETSYFTTAIISSLEYRTAYERFFLGDTYRMELDYIKDHILNANISSNPVYNQLSNDISKPNSKLHIFVEPTNKLVVEQVNNLINTLSLNADKQIYLHLLLTQQTINEYDKLIDIVNYIKYHLNSHITVGFIVGKEFYTEEMTKEEMLAAKKTLFFCSCERWSNTDQKLLSLKESNIRPCLAPNFCAVNSCNIEDGDTIMFFNTRKTSYDKFIHAIYDNARSAFNKEDFSLPLYSMIQLDTKYNVSSFASNIVYENSLSTILEKANKKALIITDDKHLSLVNFLANGLNYVNNPNIQFVKSDPQYLNSVANITNLIDNSDFDLIIFDYHMDVSKTINDLKMQLAQIDVVLGMVADVCVNKHSLFITSLYGLKKEIPLADYNAEVVTLDYEMQIPIFFFDYSYPRSKYMLFPGETNDILQTAIKCVWPEGDLYSLIRVKGIINNILGAFRK